LRIDSVGWEISIEGEFDEVFFCASMLIHRVVYTTGEAVLKRRNAFTALVDHRSPSFGIFSGQLEKERNLIS
jgi:hypothetical protein